MKDHVIIVSACLLGIPCRYDGRQKAVRHIILLAEHNTIVPVCPEQLGGLSTPRQPSEICGGTGVDVVNNNAKVVSQSGADVTANFLQGARQALHIARLVHADTAVFKERSPSCGVYSLRKHGEKVGGCGVTAAMFFAEGIRVLSDEDLLPDQV